MISRLHHLSDKLLSSLSLVIRSSSLSLSLSSFALDILSSRHSLSLSQQRDKERDNLPQDDLITYGTEERERERSYLSLSLSLSLSSERYLGVMLGACFKSNGLTEDYERKRETAMLCAREIERMERESETATALCKIYSHLSLLSCLSLILSLSLSSYLSLSLSLSLR